MYKIIRVMFLLIFILLITSCGARREFEHAPQTFDALPPPAAAVPPGLPIIQGQVAAARRGEEFWYGGVYEQEAQAPAERLIIQEASLRLETEDFDEAVTNLRNIPVNFNGYTQSERLFTIREQRQFEIVIRVPAVYFDDAIEHIQKKAYTRRINVTAEDVTDRFYDIASRLETRLIEEERILTLIAQANELRDLLTLESRLSDTRLQIARYRTSLTDLAGRITYSTIHVHLFDVEEIPEIIFISTFGERVGGAFGTSVDVTIRTAQQIIVILAGAIIPLGIILLIVILLFRYTGISRKLPRPMKT